MKAFVSSLFCVLHFPHQGEIVTIDHLDYYTPDLRTNSNTNVSFVEDSPRGYASVGVGILKDSSLLGAFPLSPLDITHIDIFNMIYSIGHSSSAYDPWVIPDPSKVESFGASMSLLSAKLSYAMLQLAGALTKPESGLPQNVEPDHHPCLYSFMQLKPLSSSFGESLATSNHVSK